jgi:dTDP-4-dehydrorhamnose 3,5-epimerase-like enzyme
MKIANGQEILEETIQNTWSSEKFNPNNIEISPQANQHGNHQENKYQYKLVRMWRGGIPIYWLCKLE